MPRILLPIFIWIVLVFPAGAQSSTDIGRLFSALGLPEMLGIMRQEGLDYGQELGQEMFPDQSGEQWSNLVAQIYEQERLRAQVSAEFEKALDAKYIAPALDFFQGPVGQEAIALEIAARRALLDDAISEANDARLAELQGKGAPRLDLLHEFIDINDLLEANVVGALNSNFAFFSGLVDGGAYDQPLSQDEILKEVWAQEEDIRKDTETWLLGFLLMAYSPLDDAEMHAYIAFSETPAGQGVNQALFESFNRMFEDVSYALGRAAAQMMSGDTL